MDRLEAVQSANDAGTKSLESAEKQGSIHLEEVIRGVQNFTNVWQLVSSDITCVYLVFISFRNRYPTR